MAAIDVSGLNYFLPLFSFLLVFIISFAVIAKAKLVGDDKWVQLLSSFLIATIFVLSVEPRTFVLNIVPWFAILLVTAFLVLALTGFIGGLEQLGKDVGKWLVYIMLVLFLISAFFVFSNGNFSSYLPGGSAVDDSSLLSWLYRPKVLGAILLLGISALVSWVLVNAKK